MLSATGAINDIVFVPENESMDQKLARLFWFKLKSAVCRWSCVDGSVIPISHLDYFDLLACISFLKVIWYVLIICFCAKDPFCLDCDAKKTNMQRLPIVGMVHVSASILEWPPSFPPNYHNILFSCHQIEQQNKIIKKKYSPMILKLLLRAILQEGKTAFCNAANGISTY